jgi:DNA-binding LacI/PurR family transcriptional regulator
MAAECRFSGVILMTSIESPSLCRMLKELSCPVVLLNRYLRSMDMDAVVLDNYLGGYEATRHLIFAGHKKILILAGIPGSTTGDGRREGYMAAMKEAGLEITPDMIAVGDMSREFGMRYAQRLIEQETDATAIFINNDAMTLGFIQGWTEGGRSVPGDMSIVCFDYTPLLDLLAVRVTSVGRDAAEMGAAAAALLLERVAGSDRPVRRVVLRPELKTGNSVKRLQ